MTTTVATRTQARDPDPHRNQETFAGLTKEMVDQ